jgi:hypothetical protein
MTSMNTERPDPERGDFDAELAVVDSRDVQLVEHPEPVHVAIQVTVHGDDAARLERIARARGQQFGEVVADLLRDADPGAA